MTDNGSWLAAISGTGKFFILLGVSYALLLLVQLWGELFDAEIFWKITVTYGVIGGAVLAVYLIRREFVDSKKMKDDGYLD